MSKIDELIDSIPCPFWADDIERIMQEYAEQYLQRFKETAVHHFWVNDFCETLINESEFNKIPNPSHE